MKNNPDDPTAGTGVQPAIPPVQVTIVSPACDPTQALAQPLKTWGTSGPHNATMTAWLNTVPQTNGTLDAVPPPGMDWSFTFPNVASGSYTLHVKGTAPGFAPKDQPCSITLQ